MPSILDTVQQQFSSVAVQQLSQRLGVDPAMAQRAVDVAVPAIMSALASRAQHPVGADSVHRQSTANVTDQQAPSATEVLGERHADVAQRVSDATGLSRGDASAILGTVAPAVLRGIGQQVQRHGMDPGQLAGVLNSAVAPHG